MRKKIIVSVLILLQLALVVFLLWLWLGTDKLVSLVGWKIKPEITKTSLTIVLPTAITDFSPFSADDRSRIILRNIYEPLVDFDENLRVQPVLASAWGMVSPTVWEFTLRQGVVFQNSDAFDADDVVFSFQKMKENPEPEAKGVLSNIASIDKVSVFKLRVTTLTPDPLLLSKLGHLLIIPNNLDDAAVESLPQKPIGSGPYRWQDQQNNTINLTSFDQYYDAASVLYPYLQFVMLPDKFARMELIKNKKADIVAAVPQELLGAIENTYGYHTVKMPTLETVFVLFNFKSVFSDITLRKNVANMVSEDKLKTVVGELGMVSSQFASSGVFGFNPDLLQHTKAVPTPVAQRLFLNIKLTQENEIVSDFLAESLEPYNIKLNSVVEDSTVLLSDVMGGRGDMFLLGFKFSDGDVADFYDTIVGSASGKASIAQSLGYGSADWNTLIDTAAHELDVKKRLKTLQQLMQKITQETVIGIPLVESNMVYAVDPDVHFTPSLDGTITYTNFSSP